MEWHFESLRPYPSFLLAKLRTGQKVNELVPLLLDELHTILKLGSEHRVLQSGGETHMRGKVEAAGFSYEVSKAAPEFGDGTRRNLEHYLVLVFRFGRSVAVHFSEQQAYGTLLRHLNETTLPVLGRLEPYKPQVLQAAFVDGPASALWLAGIHRRTTLKPDNKTLQGGNLWDALDPLRDQGYYMSAGRSEPQIGTERIKIGVSLFKSKVWLSGSRSFDECVEIAKALLTQVGTTKVEEANPIPFLASASALDKLEDAYEMAIMPPELQIDTAFLPYTEIQKFEEWQEKTSFQIHGSAGREIDATVLYSGQELGRVRFRLFERSQGEIALETETQSTNPCLKELLQYCRRHHWLKIWFASGDTLANNRVFRTQLRDYTFEDFMWETLSGYTVTKEKPATGEVIGTANSLFCWTVERWATKGDDSWLVCDDGAMELADFIHLDGRVLTVIHEKAASTIELDRGLSVSSFEIVVSQAIKGLRYLDHLRLHEGLAQGLRKKIAKAVWHRGARSSRELFLNELQSLGSNYRPRVMIVQPQLTDLNLEKGSTAQHRHESMRYRQLMNLLNAAQGSARDLGAELIVVGQKLAAEKKLPLPLRPVAGTRRRRMTA